MSALCAVNGGSKVLQGNANPVCIGSDDRLKDMIITGAGSVWSQEVENALAAYPAVSKCAVIGKPDPLWGEAVHAIVTLREAIWTTEAELIAHCRNLIAHYKCP